MVSSRMAVKKNVANDVSEFNTSRFLSESNNVAGFWIQNITMFLSENKDNSDFFFPKTMMFQKSKHNVFSSLNQSTFFYGSLYGI